MPDEKTITTGFDLDGVITRGIHPTPGSVVITGRVMTEETFARKYVPMDIPIYYFTLGKDHTTENVAAFKAETINKLGLKVFYEDQEKIVKILQKDTKAKVVLVDDAFIKKSVLDTRKFVVVTKDFEGLGFAKKLQDEGHQVIIAYGQEDTLKEKEKASYDLLGNGIVKKFPLDQVFSKRNSMKNWYWIWDSNHNVKENMALRSEGFKVFGGGKFANTMEHDREACLSLMRRYGIQSPPTFSFTDTSGALAFVQQNEDCAYVFKPDEGDNFETWVPESVDPKDANKELQVFLQSLKGTGSFILQERKDGVEVNAEVWFSKGQPVFAYANFESKKKLAGDLGEMMGCAFDFGFEVSLGSKLIYESVAKMYPLYEKMNYTGFGDLNFIVAKDGLWAFEKCERFGYNAHPNVFFNLNQKPLGLTLTGLINGTFIPYFSEGFGASVTLYADHPKDGNVIQYPSKYENNLYFMYAYKEGEHFCTNGFYPVHAIALGSGYTIPTAWEDAMKVADSVKFQNIAYRNDGDKTTYHSSPIRRFEALKAMKYL